MTFDPKTHKFGMAYVVAENVIHPYKIDNDYVHYHREVYPNDFRDLHCHISIIIRAPEHDLIPVAVADKAEKKAFWHGFELSRGFPDRYDILTFWDEYKALTEYEASKLYQSTS